MERRLGELLIMRVNGFSLKQVIGYLLRESVFVTCIGIILGVVLGVPFTESLIRGFEGTTAMYIRTPYIWVWVVSILFNLSFAAFIDYISFRKIKKLSLTNIVA